MDAHSEIAFSTNNTELGVGEAQNPGLYLYEPPDEVTL